MRFDNYVVGGVELPLAARRRRITCVSYIIETDTSLSWEIL